MTEKEIIALLRQRLTEKRFEHSLAVADEAVRLAKKYGADPEKARIAGLLHDVMKNETPENQLQLLAEFGILLDTLEQRNHKLLHSISGAVYIEKVLGIQDPDIVQAVRYHTTGRAGMSLLEKVIYLADFTSADRDYPDVDEMRRRVDISMESAMLYALTYTIKKMVKKGSAIHPNTLFAYNEVVLAVGGDGDKA